MSLLDWDDDVQVKSFFSLITVIFGIVFLIIAALLHSVVPQGEVFISQGGTEMHRTLPIIIILYVLGGLTFLPGLVTMLVINSENSRSDFSWLRKGEDE